MLVPAGLNLVPRLAGLPPSWSTQLKEAGFSDEEIVMIIERRRLQQQQMGAYMYNNNPPQVCLSWNSFSRNRCLTWKCIVTAQATSAEPNHVVHRNRSDTTQPPIYLSPKCIQRLSEPRPLETRLCCHERQHCVIE